MNSAHHMRIQLVTWIDKVYAYDSPGVRRHNGSVCDVRVLKIEPSKVCGVVKRAPPNLLQQLHREQTFTHQRTKGCCSLENYIP